jgi:hypothetical protein
MHPLRVKGTLSGVARHATYFLMIAARIHVLYAFHAEYFFYVKGPAARDALQT